MPDSRGMSRSFSLYLDALRLAAALTVMLAHTARASILGAPLLPNSVGHNAVVVFFLLSGYVIAYVAEHKENDAASFWTSRLARIYSVALPAVLLAPLADMLGQMVDARAYAGLTTHDYGWLRVAASLLFANELWLVSIMPFSNSAYWSLCYEMAYYLLFSLWCFGRGARRWLWLALAMLLIGPKILLLAPVWCLGVVVYRWQGGYAIGAATGWLLWLASLVGLAAFQYWDVGAALSHWTGSVLGPELYRQLHFSKHFLGDYPLALLIAMNFIGFRRIAPAFDSLFAALAPALRRAAGYTFSIYLFHLPLVLLFEVLLAGMGQGYAYLAAVLAATLASVVLLGSVTELQKERLRQWLRRQLAAGGKVGYQAAEPRP
ncbi:acyltransferase family protein [Pseudoduganella sp.]|uniref:acyltransferase family protein n=1 Tax=Pseudoduganella sp. TaxID=1880898 RepID=UPI0035AD7F9F